VELVRPSSSGRGSCIKHLSFLFFDFSIRPGMVLPVSSNTDFRIEVRYAGYGRNCRAANANDRTRGHNHASLEMRPITGGSCAAPISVEGQEDSIPGGQIIGPRFAFLLKEIVMARIMPGILWCFV
jgi:hypothetical protein